MYFLKVLFLIISLFVFNINANGWDFEKTESEEGYNYSSFVFANNYDNFFSVYCSENSHYVNFLIHFKDKSLFNEEVNFVNVYFNNNKQNEYNLVANYDKGSIFFDNSSFFIGNNNHYNFNSFVNDIKKSKTITFSTNLNETKSFDFNLKKSLNSLNKLSKYCNI